MRGSAKPSARQASTKSRSFIASVERARDAGEGRDRGERDREDQVDQSAPSIATSIRPMISGGKLSSTSIAARDQAVDDAAEVAARRCR